MPVFICQGCGAEHQSWTGRCPECGTSETIRLAPNTDRMVDRIIKNKFRIVKKLGQGGMGAVYLAEQVGIGHKVALKFLKAEFSSDAEIARRFLNEAKSYARVAHPNAVALHDFGQDEEGNLFIAMEYCEGVDLKKMLAEKPLAMIESIDVVLQVADVLANAHEKGVIHRDLKPENIMVRRGLRGLHAKVLDFGIARLMDGGTRLTVVGAIAGTPRYMSPEQVEGKEVDLRADIYSLGVVLFELLTGRQPFDGSTIAEILRKQAVEPMPHLTEFAPELDYPDLDAVLQKACRKRRDERWPDMLAFANALSMATPTQADVALTPLQRSSIHRAMGTPKPTVPDATPASTSGVAMPGQPADASAVDQTRLKPATVPPGGISLAPIDDLEADISSGPSVQRETRKPPRLATDAERRQGELTDQHTGGPPGPSMLGELGSGPGASASNSVLLPPSRAPMIGAAAVVVLLAVGVGLYVWNQPAPSAPSAAVEPAGPSKVEEVEAPVKVAPTTGAESKAAGVEPLVEGVREEVRSAIVEGTIDSFYSQGVAQFDAANLDAAESFLEKIPASSKYSAQALEIRKKIASIRDTLAAANAERNRGRPENAIRLYQDVLRLNPQMKAAREGLSVAREQVINPIMQ